MIRFKTLFAALLLLTTSAVAQQAPQIKATATGGGYYRVFVDGQQVSQHTTERAALEKSANEKMARPGAEVFYDHDYRVSLGANAAPPKPPVDPPLPPVDPPVEPEPEEPGLTADPPTEDEEPQDDKVLISRPFDTQEEVAAYHWVTGMSYKSDDPRAGKYDSGIGGAVLRIVPGQPMASLRKDSERKLAPTSGRVYAQWDFYVPQSFYDLDWSEMNWTSIKTFRVFNLAKRETNSDISATCTFLPTAGEVWVRTAGKYAEGTDLKIKYLPPADRWVTHRITKDYDAMRLEFTSHDEDGGLLASASCRMETLTPMDNMAALLHSTRRDLKGYTGSHETFLGYRNLILAVEKTAK